MRERAGRACIQQLPPASSTTRVSADHTAHATSCRRDEARSRSPPRPLLQSPGQAGVEGHNRPAPPSPRIHPRPRPPARQNRRLPGPEQWVRYPAELLLHGRLPIPRQTAGCSFGDTITMGHCLEALIAPGHGA